MSVIDSQKNQLGNFGKQIIVLNASDKFRSEGDGENSYIKDTGV